MILFTDYCEMFRESEATRMLNTMRHRENLILLSCVLLFAFSAVHAGAPTVRTRNGTLEGLVMQTRRGRDFIGFRGIPYATPPLGELRFQVDFPVYYETHNYNIVPMNRTR